VTPKKPAEPKDEPSRGVLDDAASLDTAGIGILGSTAQVSVTLPVNDDDDLADDEIVDGEVVDLVIDDPQPGAAEEADADATAPAFSESIVIELPEPQVAETVDVTPDDARPAASAVIGDDEPETEADAAVAAPAGATPTDAVAAEAEAAAAFIARAKADLEATASAARASVAGAAPRASASTTTAAAPASTTQTTKGVAAVDTSEDRTVAAQPARAARSEVTLTSKRLDDLGDASRESADLLTADRLLDPARLTKPEPEGAWSHFLYTVSGRRINIGDGRRARERKALSARIAAPLSGGARFVPVLSRKGGVGKTTITALLGMALADARDDRVIAVDANPDRGTLADRVVRPHHTRSVRDLVRIHDDVKGYHDISAIVARDATRLDVLASDSDPRIAEAFSDSDYRDVADVAARYYSLVLTDTGTGIVHSVMSATLDLADQIVIVSGLSVDEARLASETLTWLETNGYAEQARDAIVVLNQSTPGAPLVRLTELEAHFGTRARKVVRVPYDPQIAGGGTIVFSHLQPETRRAARELAALLVEGLRARAD